MTLLFPDGYTMTSCYQEPGFIRVTDSNGEVRSYSKAEWAKRVELSLKNGASRV